MTTKRYDENFKNPLFLYTRTENHLISFLGTIRLYRIHEYHARKDFIHRNLNTDYYDGNSKLQHQTFTKRNRGT